MILFGENLQKLRASRGWSQAYLAKRLGISSSQVANYELGRRGPSVEVLIDSARLFGVTTDYLLGIENSSRHSVDVTDLSPEEIDFIDSVVSCYRTLREKNK